jgi:predicted kinase
LDRFGVTIALPPGAMVVLIGVSGCGKSTFAATRFRPTEILSSDAFRAMVADDPGDQGATDAAFELLHTALSLRLARGRLSVVDATNVETWARAQLLGIARRNQRPAVAIVLDLPLELCLARNEGRSDHSIPAAAVRRQHRLLRTSLGTVYREGFDEVLVLTSPEMIVGISLLRG